MADVLVVDDDAALREVLGSFLELSGYEVALASGGHEALALLAASPVQLVLTDVTMPEMDGVELAKRIRERHPDLPILAHTGMPTPMSATPFDAVLLKPIGMSDILAKIEQYLVAQPSLV